MHVGEDEVLFDDSVRYGESIESQGGTVQIPYVAWHDPPH